MYAKRKARLLQIIPLIIVFISLSIKIYRISEWRIIRGDETVYLDIVKNKIYIFPTCIYPIVGILFSPFIHTQIEGRVFNAFLSTFLVVLPFFIFRNNLTKALIVSIILLVSPTIIRSGKLFLQDASDMLYSALITSTTLIFLYKKKLTYFILIQILIFLSILNHGIAITLAIVIESLLIVFLIINKKMHYLIILTTYSLLVALIIYSGYINQKKFFEEYFSGRAFDTTLWYIVNQLNFSASILKNDIEFALISFGISLIIGKDNKTRNETLILLYISLTTFLFISILNAERFDSIYYSYSLIPMYFLTGISIYNISKETKVLASIIIILLIITNIPKILYMERDNITKAIGETNKIIYRNNVTVVLFENSLSESTYNLYFNKKPEQKINCNDKKIYRIPTDNHSVCYFGRIYHCRDYIYPLQRLAKKDIVINNDVFALCILN